MKKLFFCYCLLLLLPYQIYRHFIIPRLPLLFFVPKVGTARRGFWILFRFHARKQKLRPVLRDSVPPKKTGEDI